MQDQITKRPTSTSRSIAGGHLRRALVTAALALATITACAGLPMPGGFGGGGKSTSSSQTTSSTSETHTVNGRPVDPATGEWMDEDRGGGASKKRDDDGAAFGATCSRNTDCDSNTCFTGHGDLGYCTKMCDSFTDCPKFWDCEKVGNAPQKICQQDAD
jgi:hypothetical protein